MRWHSMAIELKARDKLILRGVGKCIGMKMKEKRFSYLQGVSDCTSLSAAF